MRWLPEPDDGDELATRRRWYDAALACCLVAAAALSTLTGLSVAALAGALALRVAAGAALGRSVSRAVVSGADARAGPTPAPVREAVDDLAATLSVPAPRVVVTADSRPDVSVVRGGDEPTVLLGAGVIDALDRSALRAVIAHELAHLREGHLRGPDLRAPAADVAGLAVCWAVVLRHLPVPAALAGGALYLLAALNGRSTAGRAVYALGSLGAVVPLRALVVRIGRLEEYRADDVAADATSPRALCRGLSRLAADADDRPAAVAVTGPSATVPDSPASGTGSHPPTSRRLARQGVPPEAFE